MRAAPSWALTNGHPEYALDIVGHLRGYWLSRGLHAEGLAWADAALQAAPAEAAAASRARAELTRAAMRLQSNDVDGHLAAATEALAIFGRLDDRLNCSRALEDLALGYTWAGDRDRARRCAEEALELARAAGDNYAIANALGKLADLTPLPQARALVDEALERYVAGGSTRDAAVTLADFAYTAILQADYATARELLASARTMARDVGEPFPLALSCGNQALAALFTDDDETATAAFRDELMLAHEYRFPLMAVEALSGLAAIAARHGDTERSRRLYGAYLAQTQAQPTLAQPLDDRIQSRILSPARAVLDAGAWEAAVRRGRDMTLEQTLRYELGELSEPARVHPL